MDVNQIVLTFKADAVSMWAYEDELELQLKNKSWKEFEGISFAFPLNLLPADLHFLSTTHWGFWLD